jgi:hypothetical protein
MCFGISIIQILQVPNVERHVKRHEAFEKQTRPPDERYDCSCVPIVLLHRKAKYRAVRNTRNVLLFGDEDL